MCTWVFQGRGLRTGRIASLGVRINIGFSHIPRRFSRCAKGYIAVKGVIQGAAMCCADLGVRVESAIHPLISILILGLISLIGIIWKKGVRS